MSDLLNADSSQESTPPAAANQQPSFPRRLLKPPLVYFTIGIASALVAYGIFYFMLGEGGRPAVKVESFAPTDEVQPGTNFTIAFSKELVSDSLLNRQLDSAPITFNPPIPGKFQWTDKNKIRFYPEALLAPSTEYTAEISAAIAAGSGYTLRGEREFAFYTPRFRVNSAALNFEFTPESNETANLAASIEFNYQVDPEEAAKAIAIEYEDGGTIPFKLKTSAPANIMALVAEGAKRNKEQDKNIRLKIAGGLLCAGGNLGLEREYVQPITLPRQQDLVVERALPRVQTPTRGYIRIEFNLPVNLAKAKEFVIVDPAISYEIAAAHHYLDLQGNFSAGKSYQLAVREGLRAIDGSPLKRDFATTVTFHHEQIPPQVDFVGEGFYLTRSGNLNLGLSTINIDKVSLNVEKVFANNLVYLLNSTQLASGNGGYYYYDDEEGDGYYYRNAGYNLKALGKQIHATEIVTAKVANEEVVTPISVRDYLAGERLGIFKFTARDHENRWRTATKWVMATDMGLLAKKAGDDLWVWVNALADLKPVPNAEVQLLSQNNQLLITARTNNEGLAQLKGVAGYAKEFDPYLITASAGNDFCFLELQRRMIPTADFEVGGMPYLEHGYDVFLYTERGVYRPGETAHLAGIVRGENLTVPASFPVKLRVKGPDDKILEEQRATLNEQGAMQFKVSLPEQGLTGKYLALLIVGEDEEIGRTAFNVEDFIPDRMKVKLATDKDSYTVGETMKIDVEAVMLFGPPAAQRRAQTDIAIEAALFAPAKWKSFTFFDETKTFSKQNVELDDVTLDENGRYAYEFPIPPDYAPPSSLRGTVAATVFEPAGRGVSAYQSVTIHPYKTYVGLRKAQEGYAKPDEETKIEFIVLNPAGEPMAKRQVEVALYRVYWQSILKKGNDNFYRYVSERVEEQAQKFTVLSPAGPGSFMVVPKDYGSYRVSARDVESNATASISFYASGWGYVPWAMDHPDRIELDLDKPSYLPGEKALVQVRAPFSGKLLLTLEREKVLSYKVVTLAQNTATIEMPITEACKPNAYVSAHLIRSTEKLERNTPARAFGVVPIAINNEANHLVIELEAPEEIRPKTKLTVNFRVRGNLSATPYLTIAAVDEGICQLTDFQTPDPHAYFYSKKRLGVDSYDMYGLLLPEIPPLLLSSAGGDASRMKHLSPVSVKRVKPVAFWSGLVKANGDGSGSVSFDLPQFNGSLRLMAAAFANNNFGAAQKNIFVREPLVLTPTLPRFIASGDEFAVPVSVFNGTGAAATVNIKLGIQGPVKLTAPGNQSLKISNQSEGQIYFACKAETTMGKVTFNLSAGAGSVKTEMSEEVPLRPPVPFITLTGSGSLEENKPAKVTFPADWIPGTADFALSVSAFPAVNFAGSLQYLLVYPHGCVEQTTSKVFPLLYFNELARLAEPELFKRNSADYYIEEGITKLESMQQSSGVFSYWPYGGYINNWGSIYAAHFLVEARKAGYTVSDRCYNRLLTALQAYQRDFHENDSYSFQTAVYGSYVLALAGKPDKSMMFYLKNNARSQLTDYSQYQLAGAFALAGDLATARALLPNSLPAAAKEEYETGGNFNSSVRAQAIMLNILAEVDPTSPLVPRLVENLTKAAGKFGHWHTTQENAYAFLALGKILKKQVEADYSGSVSLTGKPVGPFGGKDESFSSKAWAGKQLNIEIKGKGTCYYYWRAEGIPSKLQIDEYDHDLRVRRRYLDRNGNPVSYDAFRQGDLLVAEITVEALNEDLDNVAIVDMLPAGFEIENPRLQSRAGIDWIGDENYKPLYMDIRDDRLVLFGNFARSESVKFYYGLSAVTQGKFILPPIRAEAMYAPSKASVASSGRVVVGQ